jgi:hypothetical protein
LFLLHCYTDEAAVAKRHPQARSDLQNVVDKSPPSAPCEAGAVKELLPPRFGSTACD